ncbi:MAG TPA: hypothetical protein VKB19_07660, partial [Pedobacter sp.]|nr:hypothetical protein [Pedobacter sp.]
AAKNHKFSSYTLAALDKYADNNCEVSITTKIDSPTAESGKEKSQFHLLDSTIQSSNCNENAELNKSVNTVIPIKIKLNRIQVQELKQSISKRKSQSR